MEPKNKRQEGQTNGVWLIVLAAGQAARMGTPKMLLSIDGEGMLRGIVRKALSVGKVAVVLKRNGKEEMTQLSDLPVTVLQPLPGKTTMSDSLKTAIQFCLDSMAKAAIILLGDQPGINPPVIRKLLSVYETTKNSLIQAKYRDGFSHPILFDRALFPELLEVTGDQGAREILKRYSSKRVWVDVAENKPMDLDTPVDYQTYITTKVNGNPIPEHQISLEDWKTPQRFDARQDVLEKKGRFK
jgi:molybdenum cofactor cytidylyltransferase